MFFLSSCVNSYIGDNTTHLWQHANNVKNMCHCCQVRTGPYKQCNKTKTKWIFFCFANWNLSAFLKSGIFPGFSRYLNMAHGVNFPPNQFWYCTLIIGIYFSSTMCCTLFILCMTFERFYGIIRPHKAASFNTLWRAKRRIGCIITVSIFYNVPHFFISSVKGGQCVPYGKALQEINFFISSVKGGQCVPYGKALQEIYGQIYNWLSYVLSFVLPFTLLLIMNVVIIHTLRKRSMSDIVKSESQGQVKGHNEGQSSKTKNSENQIFITLLLVTFAYLIFTTPGYMMFLYSNIVDVERSAYTLAGWHLFFSVGQKALYTNHAINFFLYVMSGQKFRTDLIGLFKCKNRKMNQSPFGNSTDLQSMSAWICFLSFVSEKTLEPICMQSCILLISTKSVFK